MLETDDVDDDYFTPIASTSLANIFGKSSKKPESKDNESLKYTPPKQHSAAPKTDDSKLTECIFATAVVGYEWSENVYTCRGNLGFAILKILKSGLHNIILYDSRKTTLSSTAIIPTLEVTINNNQSMSYYDNLRKYWSITVNDESFKTIMSLLKSFNVQTKDGSSKDEELSKSQQTNEYIRTEPDEINKKEVESDTDSSINRKTKMSLLNRMANMGHSVLPPNINVKDKSSDSSDTSEHLIHTKATRHKPVKNVIKRVNTDKTTALCTPQKMFENEPSHVALTSEKVSDNPALYTYVNGVLVPVTSTSLISTPVDKTANNIDFFVNEQRMNNTEMRINVNRITDKVDHIIQKLNNLEQKGGNESSSHLHMDIYQKLLVEYENKIKIYEDLLKTKDETTKISNVENSPKENKMENVEQELKTEIMKLEQVNKEKDHTISRLEDELSLLQQKVENFSLPNVNKEESEKIKELELLLSDKEAKLKNITIKYESLLKNINDSDIEEKIKNIMNNTYQTISGNFENDVSYSGEAIKKTIAVVIRNITLNSLNAIV